MLKKYTVGIGVTQEDVMLVRKNRPEWQAGKLNFIGGKVEPGETPVQCMVREFREETGVHIHERFWRYVGKTYRENDFICHIYVTAHPDVELVETKTDEEIVRVNMDKMLISETLRRELISNVRTIFEFVLSDDFLDQDAMIVIKYPKVRT